MYDLSHALRVELAELAINRNSSSNGNCRQGRIRTVLFSLFEIQCFLRSSENFKLVGGFVESQLKSVATCFAFRTTKSDEAFTADEFPAVILDDVVGTPPRDEPPDDHFASPH